jgi:hypothetical protein
LFEALVELVWGMAIWMEIPYKLSSADAGVRWMRIQERTKTIITQIE